MFMLFAFCRVPNIGTLDLKTTESQVAPNVPPTESNEQPHRVTGLDGKSYPAVSNRCSPGAPLAVSLPHRGVLRGLELPGCSVPRRYRILAQRGSQRPLLSIISRLFGSRVSAGHKHDRESVAKSVLP